MRFRSITLYASSGRRWFINLPDTHLVYPPEGSTHFHDYVEAVGWAQDYVHANRELMMQATAAAITRSLGRAFEASVVAINSHDLCRARASFRRKRTRHPQGSGAGARGRSGHHLGVDGR